jgi:hypothetical protein
MKKIIIPIVILACIGVFYGYTQRAKPEKNLAAVLPQVLGDSTNIAQNFAAATSKAGFHVYYPKALPDGYSLDGVSVNSYSDGEIDYAIVQSGNDNNRFIISEAPSSLLNSANITDLITIPEAMQAMQWNISNVSIGNATGTLGQATAQSGSPSGHEELYYTTSDGVVIDIFDSFGYGAQQLTQLAQSMQ